MIGHKPTIEEGNLRNESWPINQRFITFISIFQASSASSASSPPASARTSIGRIALRRGRQELKRSARAMLRLARGIKSDDSWAKGVWDLANPWVKMLNTQLLVYVYLKFSSWQGPQRCGRRCRQWGRLYRRRWCVEKSEISLETTWAMITWEVWLGLVHSGKVFRGDSGFV